MTVYTRSTYKSENIELQKNLVYWRKKFLKKISKKMTKMECNPTFWESIKIIRSVYNNLFRSMKYLFNSCIGNFNNMLIICYNRSYILEENLKNEFIFCKNSKEIRYISITINILKKYRNEWKNRITGLYSNIPNHLPLEIRNIILEYILNKK